MRLDLSHVFPNKNESITGYTLNLCDLCDNCPKCLKFMKELYLWKFNEFRKSKLYNVEISWIRIHLPIIEENKKYLTYRGFESLLSLLTRWMKSDVRQSLEDMESFMIVSPMVDSTTKEPGIIVDLILYPVLGFEVFRLFSEQIQELNIQEENINFSLIPTLHSYKPPEKEIQETFFVDDYCDFFKIVGKVINDEVIDEFTEIVRWGVYYLKFNGSQFTSQFFELNRGK